MRPPQNASHRGEAHPADQGVGIVEALEPERREALAFGHAVMEGTMAQSWPKPGRTRSWHRRPHHRHPLNERFQKAAMPKQTDLTISKRTVDALSVEGRDAVFWDRDLPGFGVRVYPSGRKVLGRVVQSRCDEIAMVMGRAKDCFSECFFFAHARALVQRPAIDYIAVNTRRISWPDVDALRSRKSPVFPGSHLYLRRLAPGSALECGSGFVGGQTIWYGPLVRSISMVP